MSFPFGSVTSPDDKGRGKRRTICPHHLVDKEQSASMTGPGLRTNAFDRILSDTMSDPLSLDSAVAWIGRRCHRDWNDLDIDLENLNPALLRRAGRSGQYRREDRPASREEER